MEVKGHLNQSHSPCWFCVLLWILKKIVLTENQITSNYITKNKHKHLNKLIHVHNKVTLKEISFTAIHYLSEYRELCLYIWQGTWFTHVTVSGTSIWEVTHTLQKQGLQVTKNKKKIEVKNVKPESVWKVTKHCTCFLQVTQLHVIMYPVKVSIT